MADPKSSLQDLILGRPVRDAMSQWRTAPGAGGGPTLGGVVDTVVDPLGLKRRALVAGANMLPKLQLNPAQQDIVRQVGIPMGVPQKWSEGVKTAGAPKPEEPTPSGDATFHEPEGSPDILQLSGGAAGGAGHVWGKQHESEAWKEIPTGDKMDYLTAQEGAKDAASSLATAQADKDERRANALWDMSDAERAGQAEMDQFQGEKKTRLADAEGFRKKTVESARRASQIDPGKFWASKSLGQKAALIVGNTLGNLGDALLGTNGPSLIEQLINQDIEIQKVNAHAKWKSADAAQLSLENLTKQLGSEEAAVNARKIAALQSLKTQMEASAAESDSAIHKANAAAFAAAADKESALLMMQNDIIQKQRAYGNIAVGGAGAGLKPNELDTKRAVRLDDGTIVYADTEKDKEEKSGALESARTVHSLTKEMQELRKDPKAYMGLGGFGTDAYSRLNSLAANLLLEGRKPGVRLTDKELAQLEKIRGNPRSPGGDAALEQADRMMQEAASRSVVGLPRVQTGFVRDQNGHVVRAAEMTGELHRPAQRDEVQFTPGFVPAKKKKK